MHIPDGYLGPLTYVAMYIVMIPIWLYAGTWLRKNLKTKQVPYLALAAAFSFVIMMFNVPIPGGSTGHAVGSALVAIILGPWVAVVTTSVALVIQAFLFGDGGITAIGGYVGISVAAGVAGFEMGIQPLMYMDASGLPLYMPYGLNVTVPAMLFEHMAVFSFVEAIVTVLAFIYITRNSPEVIFDYVPPGKEKTMTTPQATP